MSPHLVKLGENAYTVSGAILSPGFHFRPTTSELISFLRCKNTNPDLLIVSLIPEIDVYAYKYLPGELLKYLPSGVLQLYFFCPIARKHDNGSKKNRSTKVGNWRLTGKDKILSDRVQPVGKKKSLVFYEKGKKTNWMMHEYTLLDVQHSVEKQQTDSDKVEYALCKLFATDPNLKDNPQTVASFGKSECTDCAYTDSILIIPESHISIFRLKESFPRATNKDECASSIRGNTDDSGTSGVENLMEISQKDHGVTLNEVEIVGDDPSLLQDNDSNLEEKLLMNKSEHLLDFIVVEDIINDTPVEQIFTPDALKQQSDIRSLEDGSLNLLDTDQDLGASVSEQHNSCLQDSQPIEMELMDIDLGDGNGNSLLCYNSQKWQMHVPTYGHEYECMTHELASSWANVGDTNANAESPCHTLFSDGIYLSDENFDELWDQYGYQMASECDTPMGDLCDCIPQLWN